MTPPTLLLTGATGFLGRRLALGLCGPWRMVRACRHPETAEDLGLDLEDEGQVARAFESLRPAAVVHAAGAALPDECERDPAMARRLNVEAVKTVAALCGRLGARLIHFSTDLVFDGEKGWYDEDAAPRPLSVYARVKLESEEAALSRAPATVVLRVSSVYGRPLASTRPCFVDELRASLSAGTPVAAFVDQWRTSTAGDQLPEVVSRILADSDLEGVFHWGGAQRATRFETAVAVCRAFGYDEGLVRPARAADKRFAAPRPRDCSLDSSRLSAAIGLAPPTLAEGFAALKGER